MRFHRSKKRQVEGYGYKFDNMDELRRYEYLREREHANEITDLEVQRGFPVTINGRYCWTYIADFSYLEQGVRVVEDCKGAYNKKKQSTRKGIVVREWTERAPILADKYLVKKPVVEAVYGITIKEIWE